MPCTESEVLMYVLDETEFHESKFANIVVENASGPGNPSASFTLFGHVSLSENNRNIMASVSAKGAIFSREAGLEKVTWFVEATLKKNQETIGEKRVAPQHEKYWTRPDTTVVGEVTFELPPPNKTDIIELHIKGSYVADFGPYASSAIPVFPPIFGSQVYAEKTFTLRVENEK